MCCTNINLVIYVNTNCTPTLSHSVSAISVQWIRPDIIDSEKYNSAMDKNIRIVQQSCIDAITNAISQYERRLIMKNNCTR